MQRVPGPQFPQTVYDANGDVPKIFDLPPQERLGTFERVVRPALVRERPAAAIGFGRQGQVRAMSPDLVTEAQAAVHSTNPYRTHRPLQEYGDTLTPGRNPTLDLYAWDGPLSKDAFEMSWGTPVADTEFGQFLFALGPDARWLDAGAGEARAMGTAMANGYRGRCTALSIKKPDDREAQKPLSAFERTGRGTYLEGRLEDSDILARLVNEGPFQVITSVYGAFDYGNASKAMAAFAALLAPGGRLYLTFAGDESTVKLVDHPAPIRLSEWVACLPGFQVLRFNKLQPCRRDPSFTMVLERTDDDARVPYLETLSYEAPHLLPVRKYAESPAKLRAKY